MKHKWRILIAFLLVGCQQERNEVEPKLENENQQIERKEDVKQEMELVINQQPLTITLEKTPTVESWLETWPVSVTMKDLNGNEKYYYTDTAMPTKSEAIGYIESGDILLFGNNCIVIFYESFSSPYAYTRLGKVEDVEHFESLVGNGKVEVLFRK